MPGRPILVVNSNHEDRKGIFGALTQAGHGVDLAVDAATATEKIERQSYALVLADLDTSGLNRGELMRLAGQNPRPPLVIVSSKKPSVDLAVAAMREGAFDFLVSPYPMEIMLKKVEQALGVRSSQTGEVPTTSPAPGHKRAIVTQDAGMKRLLKMASNVARSKATVLIEGPSGTGKELIARHVHESSDRAEGPFVAVNCASLPEGLLESELFGHEKGAFTGAIARKAGRFELAHGGTILLDEISEMELGLQAKLLRVLQEQEVDRVGGRQPISVDIRVIATTNRDLFVYAQEGKFRQDLYYRLNVIPLKVPPLKDRPGDIPLLSQYFLEKFRQEAGRPGLALSESALQMLVSCPWPGNVRELENILARGVLLAEGGLIQPADLFLEAAPDEVSSRAAVLPADKPREIMTIREMERELIGKALDQTDGNRTHAAKILGISVRTLRNKLSEYKDQAEAKGQAA